MMPASDELAKLGGFHGHDLKLEAKTETNDLLYLLMMQNGTKLSDNGGKRLVSFASPNGVQALNFYSPLYKAGAIDDFSQGKTAMTFAYARDLPRIALKNGFLNFAVAPVPQPKNAALNFVSELLGLCRFAPKSEPSTRLEFHNRDGGERGDGKRLCRKNRQSADLELAYL